MRNMKKVRQNLILCLVACAVYMLVAYIDRGYYAVGLEVFLPVALWVAWLYTEKVDN